MSDHVGEIKGIADVGGWWLVKFRDLPDGQYMIGVVDQVELECCVSRLEDWTKPAFEPVVIDSLAYCDELNAAIAAWQQATPTQRTTWGRIKGDFHDAP